MTSHPVESSTVALDANAVMTVKRFAERATVCVLTAHAKGFYMRHTGNADNLSNYSRGPNNGRGNHYLGSWLLNNNRRRLLIYHLRLLVYDLRCLLIDNLGLLLVHNLRLLLIDDLRLLLLRVVLLRLLLLRIGLHRHLLLRVISGYLLLRVLLLLRIAILLLLRLRLIVHL